jgi:hypothetical protein
MASDAVNQLTVQLQALAQQWKAVEEDNAHMQAQLTATIGPGSSAATTTAQAATPATRMHNLVQLNPVGLNGHGALAAMCCQAKV